MQKIIVSGFPHSGTTILRKLIGNHSKVFDVGRECYAVDEKHIEEFNRENTKKKRRGKSVDTHIAVKGPWGDRVIQNLDQYSDYKVVIIVKNPLDVYASLKLRFADSEFPEEYSFEKWREFAQMFQALPSASGTAGSEGEGRAGVFKMTYDELFENDYQKLKDLVEWLGLEWEDQVVKGNAKRRIPINSYYIPTTKPDRQANEKFRSWQTNQPLTNMSGEKRHVLSDKEVEMITSCPEYKAIFQ
jgi:hypothetical protein